jgi:hypothetical protein
MATSRQIESELGHDLDAARGLFNGLLFAIPIDTVLALIGIWIFRGCK